MWLEQHAARQCSMFTLYNYVCCILKASHFCSVSKDLQQPAVYHGYLDAKSRVMRRWRSTEETLGTGRWARTPRPAASVPGSTAEQPVRPEDAAGRRSSMGISESGELASMSQNDFLFALGYSLMHAMVAPTATPSALYTLSTEVVELPVGHWEDRTPVPLRNTHNKTGAYVGPCSLVLSGQSKKGLCLYYYTARRAALLCCGLDSSVDHPLHARNIRKVMTSRLQETKSNDDNTARTTSSALCHSVPTSDRYYVLKKEDRQAMDLHKMVDAILGDWVTYMVDATLSSCVWHMAAYGPHYCVNGNGLWNTWHCIGHVVPYSVIIHDINNSVVLVWLIAVMCCIVEMK